MYVCMYVCMYVLGVVFKQKGPVKNWQTTNALWIIFMDLSCSLKKESINGSRDSNNSP